MHRLSIIFCHEGFSPCKQIFCARHILGYFGGLLELTKEPLGCLARYSASMSSSSEAASTAVAGLADVIAALNISLTFSGVAPASPLHMHYHSGQGTALG